MSEEIAKLISKSTDLISYYSTAKEYFEAEISKLRTELAQLKAVIKNIPQEDWQEPSLLNGWTAYGHGYHYAAYFKDNLNIVHMKGLIKGGTPPQGSANVIFNFPEGYRPRRSELHVVCTFPDVAGRINIEPDGNVWMVSGNNGWISLDGITFRAA